MILLLLASFASPVFADSVADCHRAIDRAVDSQPPIVKAPGCSPIDPACSSLKSAAEHVGKVQQKSIEKNPVKRALPEGCRPKVDSRCVAYAKLRKQGWDE